MGDHFKMKMSRPALRFPWGGILNLLQGSFLPSPSPCPFSSGKDISKSASPVDEKVSDREVKPCIESPMSYELPATPNRGKEILSQSELPSRNKEIFFAAVMQNSMGQSPFGEFSSSERRCDGFLDKESAKIS